MRCYFFFQAEDGIRDRTVTGVQTCALPICFTDGHQTLTNTNSTGVFAMTDPRQPFAPSTYNPGGIWWDINLTTSAGDLIRTVFRSEERRVGKEYRCGRAQDQCESRCRHHAVLFFFSSRRRHTRSYGDWSSDVCSSDLLHGWAPDAHEHELDGRVRHDGPAAAVRPVDLQSGRDLVGHQPHHVGGRSHPHGL